MKSESQGKSEAGIALTQALAAWDERDVAAARQALRPDAADREFLAAVVRRARRRAMTSDAPTAVFGQRPAGWLAGAERRLALADRAEVSAAIWFIACLPAFLAMQLGGWPAIAAAAAGLAAGAAIENVRAGAAGAVKE